MDNDPEQPDYKEFSDDEIKSILREALALKLTEKRKLPKRNELNNALIGTLGEFLACFKLMGYDLEGNPVNMTVYKEKLEKAALDHMFMNEVGVFMQNRMG